MVRNTTDQKKKFREYIKAELSKYYKNIDDSYSKLGRTTSNNIIIGDLEEAQMILTAHYDTPRRIPRFLLPHIVFRKISLIRLIVWCIILLAVILFSLAFTFARIGLMPAATIAWLVSMVILIACLILTVLLLISSKKARPNVNNYNDNTSGIVTLIETIVSLSADNRKKVAFVMFDNEEKGLKGSKAFAKQFRKIISDKIIINFDAVGDGDNIIFACPMGTDFQTHIEKTIDQLAKKLPNKKAKFYLHNQVSLASDHRSFKKHKNVFAVSTFNCKHNFLYIDKMHSDKDVVLDDQNIELLSNTLVNLV